jgi:hypothetical protein
MKGKQDSGYNVCRAYARHTSLPVSPALIIIMYDYTPDEI